MFMKNMVEVEWSNYNRIYNLPSTYHLNTCVGCVDRDLKIFKETSSIPKIGYFL